MEMSYRHMVEHAKKAGVTTEKTMWESIDSFSELLEELKESHPKLYWEFMRKQHGIMFNDHYDESFAIWDVSQMHSTDKTGVKREGPHWTVEQVETATAGLKFPVGTTKFDKFVAMNAAWHDWNKVCDDAEVLKIGYAFWFADEDWDAESKIWEYMEHKPRRHE